MRRDATDRHTHERAKMSYRFENTESYRLVVGLRKALSDVMEVPNEWLP